MNGADAIDGSENRADTAKGTPNEPDAVSDGLDIDREDAVQRMRLAQIQKKYFPLTQAQLDHTERLERESIEREEREEGAKS